MADNLPRRRKKINGERRKVEREHRRLGNAEVAMSNYQLPKGSWYADA